MRFIQLSNAYDRSVTAIGEGAFPDVPVLDQARRRRVAKPADVRRQDILDAATRLFREQGFAATTVQMIAEESHVAAGTIYLHFASKEAILAALDEDFESGLLDRVSAVATEVLAAEDASGEIATYEHVVDRLVDGLVAYARERRDLTLVLARHGGRGSMTTNSSSFGGGLTEVVAGLIRDGARRGYVASSDPEMAAHMLTFAAAAAIRHAVTLDDDALLERVVRYSKELYVKALAPI
jgi:AcrR family transcriptional regulator